MKTLKQNLVEAAERFRAGTTLQEIANAYGVSRQYVQQLFKMVGIGAADGGAKMRTQANKAAARAIRDKECQHRYGCSEVEWKAIPIAAKKAYTIQKSNARTRGIAWEFTMHEWWSKWLESGFWDKRGRGKYVMARNGDVGAYSSQNTRIITSTENVRESYVFKPAAVRKKRAVNNMLST